MVNTFKLLPFILSGQLSVGDKVTPDLLEAFIGTSRSESYEIRITWRHLGLLDDRDGITPTCEALARAVGEQRQILLQSILRESYAEIYLTLSDPAHASQEELKEAFQQSSYVPISMHPKMITLFRKLCYEAGLIEDETRDPPALEKAAREEPSLSSQSTTDLEEGNLLMKGSLSLLYMNGFVHTKGNAQTEEPHRLLAYLLQLPEASPDWTEEDETWWRQAISINTEKILQTRRQRGKKPV
jgi:hypothetical protein